MNTRPQPIKRSKELAPLSREHHEGLLFGWKIRQGIKNKVDPLRIANFCEWFWQGSLETHFENEEKEFLDVLTSDHQMIVRMTEEHKAIRQKIKDIGSSANYENLEELAQLVVDHIRFEERVLFNHIEAVATKEQLNEIEKNLAKSHLNAPAWSDEFWVSH